MGMLINYETFSDISFEEELEEHLNTAVHLGYLSLRHARAAFKEWIVDELIDTTIGDEAELFLAYYEDEPSPKRYGWGNDYFDQQDIPFGD